MRIAPLLRSRRADEDIGPYGYGIPLAGAAQEKAISAAKAMEEE